jgi:hypothetical protein
LVLTFGLRGVIGFTFRAAAKRAATIGIPSILITVVAPSLFNAHGGRQKEHFFR